MSGAGLIIFLLIIIVLKQFTNILNSKLYVREYKDIIKNNSHGYFGVGTFQPKLGIGQVCLIVIDDQNIIRECRLINGLSIFAKFHQYVPVIDQSTKSEAVLNDKHRKVLYQAVQNASNARTKSQRGSS
ncbi:transcriptional regulator GutM [Loigolactobacillus coryniformis]|uniref:transcriptional regulator GutM n=1 Tax=Loigolactobacillus coryniformis TaxID=1610 RepID=UPI00345D3A17